MYAMLPDPIPEKYGLGHKTILKHVNEKSFNNEKH